MYKFRDKNVLITGAARGLGRAIALKFAESGANLILSDICSDIGVCPYPLGTWEQLQSTEEASEVYGVDLLTVQCDVRDPSSVDNLITTSLDKFGKIDILINNAGLIGPGGKPTHAFSEEEWNAVIDTNINGVWRCSKAVLENMIEEKEGIIINIASTGGQVGFRSFSSYVASKHAVIGLTKAMALDYSMYGIRVNCVCPTSIIDEEKYDSSMLQGISDMYHIPLEEYEKISKQGHPLNTLVSADDVADSVIWLASNHSKKLTGTSINVDSGFTIK